MKGIRWGWILLGGFLAELAIFVIVIPLSLLVGQQSLLYSAPPASFTATFVFGVWIAGKTPQRRVLHGAFVGFAATVIYVGISLGRPEPIAYVIAHALNRAPVYSTVGRCLDRASSGSRLFWQRSTPEA